MLHLVDGGVHADCCWCAGECLIEACLAHIGAEPVDGLEPCSGVDRKEIGPQTSIWAVLEVCILEGEMTRALVGVVGQVDVCELGEERAGVFGERVECEAVEDYSEDLRTG
jgi:hypothetical protein